MLYNEMVHTALLVAILTTQPAMLIAVAGYLARRIDRLEERSAERHEALLAGLNSHGERLAHVEGWIEGRAQPVTAE